MVSCPYCAESIQDKAIVCRFCQRDLATGALACTSRRTHGSLSLGFAALLSFLIPGLGQMYRGHVAAGFLWLVATLIGYLLLIVPGVVLHIWCIVSAARPDRYRHANTGHQWGGVAFGG